jgi:hypothetical protein
MPCRFDDVSTFADAPFYLVSLCRLSGAINQLTREETNPNRPISCIGIHDHCTLISLPLKLRLKVKKNPNQLSSLRYIYTIYNKATVVLQIWRLTFPFSGRIVITNNRTNANCIRISFLWKSPSFPVCVCAACAANLASINLPGRRLVSNYLRTVLRMVGRIPATVRYRS